MGDEVKVAGGKYLAREIEPTKSFSFSTTEELAVSMTPTVPMTLFVPEMKPEHLHQNGTVTYVLLGDFRIEAGELGGTIDICAAAVDSEASYSVLSEQDTEVEDER